VPKPHSNSNLEKELELIIKERDELKLELIQLQVIIDENGLLEEDKRKMSDAELICIMQIKRLYDKSLVADFTETDAKILDTLHKNLRLARGQTVEKDKSKKAKKLSTAQLLELVKDVN
jgi:hypothetical protein